MRGKFFGATPMRPSGIIVKAFDGSRKSVIGEVDLPIHIGPYLFQITFQVMDIVPAYSCLLGRPWIHEAGAVTSTLHQKLKFVRERKVVIINGEQALLISHLTSFSIVEADEAVVGTQFQALSIDNIRGNENSMVLLKDAQQVVRKGHSEVWGQIMDPSVNKNRVGLGLSLKNDKGKGMNPNYVARKYQDIFCSGGYLHPTVFRINAIMEYEAEQERPNYVTHGVKVQNRITIDVPSCIHVSK